MSDTIVKVKLYDEYKDMVELENGIWLKGSRDGRYHNINNESDQWREVFEKIDEYTSRVIGFENKALDEDSLRPL